MFDFPNSPSNGQTATAPNGVTYRWDTVKWTPLGTGGAPSIYVGDTPPTNPSSGTLWFDSAGGQLYLWYVDPNTSQWVPSNAPLQTQPIASGFNNAGRNLIHNPLFNVAQRGTGPFTTLPSYGLDRWSLSGSTDAVSWTQAALTDTDRAQIGDEVARVCAQNVFTGNAAAGAYNELYQFIEGVARLANRTVTISFYAVASAALKVGINAVQSFGTGGSPSANVNVLASAQVVTLGTTWARYSVTLAFPSIAGKTLGTNNNDANQIRFGFSASTNAGPYFGNIGVQSGTVKLWGVQLEVGTQATPLDYGGSPADQLAQCQRFYQVGQMLQASYQASGAGIGIGQLLPVTMRANPTIVVTANNNSGPFGTFSLTGNQFWVVSQAIMTGTSSFTINVNFSASADL